MQLNFLKGNNENLPLEENRIEDTIYYVKDKKQLILNDLIIEDSETIKGDIDGIINQLLTNTELKFFCIEEVSVSINDVVTVYPPNSSVKVLFKNSDTFSITPTSNKSISTLEAWPGALSTFYDWLEGVNVFNNILFDMNDLSMYEKWNQGHQGQFHVQYAQYSNCVFWSDNAYISDVALRTNYTLYSSAQLPLCYSTIPENTFKAFYCAYGVINDPNWSNDTYISSFALANYATQVFSYYGARSIGVYNMAVKPIILPKDCRGLMFSAPSIRNAGVFDATNVTNFGAKSGSWRDAFAYCYSLENLYIRNLKVAINVSWSPINQDSIEYILSNAANTKNIKISLSPYTYYRLTDANKALATEKNITFELITTNFNDDVRFNTMTNEINTLKTQIQELTTIVNNLTNTQNGE